MSEPARQLVVSLDAIAADPTLALSLEPEAARLLTVRAAAAIAALVAAPVPNGPASTEPAPALLDIDGVAERLSVSRSWVEHNYRDLPTRVRVQGRPRWRTEDIDRWAATRPKYGRPWARRSNQAADASTAKGVSAADTDAGGFDTDATDGGTKSAPTRPAAKRR